MRLYSLLVVAFLTVSCARSADFAPTPEPTAVPSGKRAQFVYGNHRWLDGYVMRFRPGTSQECLAVFAPALSGAVMLGEMDSLRLDQHPGIGTRGPFPPPIDTLPAPIWQNIAVPELLAREPGFCASHAKRAS